jgi:hypothetical protein
MYHSFPKARKITSKSLNLLSTDSSEHNEVKSRKEEYRNLAKAMAQIDEEKEYHKVDYSNIPYDVDEQGRTKKEQIQLEISNLANNKKILIQTRATILNSIDNDSENDNDLQDRKLLNINRKIMNIDSNIDILKQQLSSQI